MTMNETHIPGSNNMYHSGWAPGGVCSVGVSGSQSHHNAGADRSPNPPEGSKPGVDTEGEATLEQGGDKLSTDERNVVQSLQLHRSAVR